jgi:predicted Fe-Mo cluster-binding NifX family protein
MKVAIASRDGKLESEVSPNFGRAPYFIFADTETGNHTAQPNPAVEESGGAGIRAAEFVANEGARAVVAGDIGPNAYRVFSAAGIAFYTATGIAAQSSLENLRLGKLEPLQAASAAAHAGMPSGRGTPRDQGPGNPPRSKQEELTLLRQKLKELRSSLTDTMERIEALEREG